MPSQTLCELSNRWMCKHFLLWAPASKKPPPLSIDLVQELLLKKWLNCRTQYQAWSEAMSAVRHPPSKLSSTVGFRKLQHFQNCITSFTQAFCCLTNPNSEDFFLSLSLEIRPSWYSFEWSIGNLMIQPVERACSVDGRKDCREAALACSLKRSNMTLPCGKLSRSFQSQVLHFQVSSRVDHLHPVKKTQKKNLKYKMNTRHETDAQ